MFIAAFNWRLRAPGNLPFVMGQGWPYVAR